MKIVADARRLQHAPPTEPEARMDAWLELLARDRTIGYATPYLQRELVCSTPPADYPRLLAKLEGGDFGYEIASTVKALKTGGTAVTDGSVADFACPGAAAQNPEPSLAVDERVPATSTASATAAPAPQAGCGAGCAAANPSDVSDSMVAVGLGLIGVSGLRRRRCGR